MATEQEVEDKWVEARLALLERIANESKEGHPAGRMLELAEAYAWLTSADQSH